MEWERIRALCREQRPETAATRLPSQAQWRSPLRVFLAEAKNGTACWDLDLAQPLALVIGGEAEGASREASALADQAITIPMPGKSESLNAAIAAGILMFEIVRQRQKR
jgi:TrmH family RNA methyltransferase